MVVIIVTVIVTVTAFVGIDSNIVIAFCLLFPKEEIHFVVCKL